MKRIVLIMLAMVVASVSMAQFGIVKPEPSQVRLEKESIRTPNSSFDKTFLLEEKERVEKNRAIPGLEPEFIETFDAAPGTNPWSIAMTHDAEYGDLDWKITNKEEIHAEVYANGAKLANFMGNGAISDFSASAGKFAYYNALAFNFALPSSAVNTAGRVKGHLTIGPFDFTGVNNPVVIWDQIYKKFNRDECYLEYSTDNNTFERVRINDIASGYATVTNNVAFIPSTLGGQPQVYFRFTYEELQSTSLGASGGYSWQVDDIAIAENVEHEIAIGRIATDFYYQQDNVKFFHASSTFGRIPKEEMAGSIPLYFNAPFINKGSVAVNPQLKVTVNGPDGTELYSETETWQGTPVPTGGIDTIRFPKTKGFGFGEDAPSVPVGRYDIKYELSIPGQEDALNKEDNISETYFYITDNGVVSRDLDNSSSSIGMSNWQGGGQDGEWLGSEFIFANNTTVYSVDLFISSQTTAGNTISVLFLTPSGGGQFDETAESSEIVITEEMRGKWLNVPFNSPVNLEKPSPDMAIQVVVAVKLQYTAQTENNRLMLGADSSAKGSYWGILYKFVGSNSTSISNGPTASLCMRLNTKEGTTSHTVSAKSEGNGSIYPNGEIMVYPGETKTFKMKADPNNKMVSFMVDGDEKFGELTEEDATYTYTLAGIQAAHTILAKYEVIKHTITALVDGDGGTIDPSGSIELEQGSYKTFTIKPNAGKVYDDVMVDKDNITSQVIATKGILEYGPVLGPKTIKATFREPFKIKITATASEGGTITPAGPAEYTEGDDVKFTFTPETDYIVEEVLVDGNQVDFDHANKSYTFVYLTGKEKTIHVSFKKPKKFKVNASVNDPNMGTIDPAGEKEVTEGDNLTYKITPKDGYKVDSLTVNNINKTSELVNGVFKIDNVKADYTIKVFFGKRIHVLKVSAGPNGSITPEGNVEVEDGADKTFEISPKPGFKVEKLTVDGVAVPEDQIVPVGGDSDDATYTHKNVSAANAIEVTFIANNSILEHALGIDVNIYPNPANDFINIEVSEEIKSVEILSIVGTTISKQNVNDNLFTYPTQELSNGNYIVRIYTNNTVIVKQFSVVK